MKLKVKIKKLVPEAVIPSKRDEDAGFDFTAITEVHETDEKGTFGYIQYGTGIVVEVPEDHVGLLFPRGSISKTGLILANSVGVIDSGYRGEIFFRFKWISRTAKYKVGDRVGQLVILPIPKVEFEETDLLTKSERNDGSFGSTGA